MSKEKDKKSKNKKEKENKIMSETSSPLLSEETENETVSPEVVPPLSPEEILMFRKLVSFLGSMFDTQSPAEPQVIYQEKIVEKEVEVIKEVIKEIEKKVEVQLIDPMRNDLSSSLNVLNLVRNDADFSTWWVSANDSEGEQMLKLTAVLAQWRNIEDVWDKLASRCKEKKRPATESELALLHGAVAIFIKSLSADSQACLMSVRIGDEYNYEKHQRGTSQGDKITAEWLPSLQNAAGEVVKKVVVATAD